MTTNAVKRRDRRWWKERWVADHYAHLRESAKLLDAMRLHNHNASSLARVVSYERIHNGSGKGVSRQMISYLANGRIKQCEPDLAAAIERVLLLPPQFLFDVLPKSRDKRESLKGHAA